MNYIESLRIDLAPRGIAVTLAAPGFVRTRDTRKQRAKPMAMPLAPAVEILARSIIEKRGYVAFPMTLAWIAHAMRLLPAGLYDRLIRRLDRGAGE
jgi:NAD(P)-dependent dehydrogenase (short-subunit alcohol dehydrogenase family)